MSAERYFMDQDSFGAYFIVPESKRVEWEEWNAIDDRDERAWIPPLYAVKVLHPRLVSFENPVEAPPP